MCRRPTTLSRRSIARVTRGSARSSVLTHGRRAVPRRELPAAVDVGPDLGMSHVRGLLPATQISRPPGHHSDRAESTNFEVGCCDAIDGERPKDEINRFDRHLTGITDPSAFAPNDRLMAPLLDPDGELLDFKVRYSCRRSCSGIGSFIGTVLAVSTPQTS